VAAGWVAAVEGFVVAREGVGVDAMGEGRGRRYEV
jgi:hypothetical protein